MTADSATPVPKRWDPRKGVPHLSQRKSFEPGTVVGKWTLTGECRSDPKSRQIRWHAVCECGRDAWPLGSTLRPVLDPTLKGRPSRSCGKCSTPPDVPFTYSGAHGHVRAKRGPASEHKCVDCGEQAHDWSYNHDDYQELIGPERPGAEEMVYSARPWIYVPRCRRCHRLFDDLMERVRSREVPPSDVPQLFAALLGKLGPLRSLARHRLD